MPYVDSQWYPYNIYLIKYACVVIQLFIASCVTEQIVLFHILITLRFQVYTVADQGIQL